jgi:hypothetical protein
MTSIVSASHDDLWGSPVPFYKCPKLLMHYKPDWHAAEVLKPREVDYYESPRALGKRYRAVSLTSPPEREKEESADPYGGGSCIGIPGVADAEGGLSLANAFPVLFGFPDPLIFKGVLGGEGC